MRNTHKIRKEVTAGLQEVDLLPNGNYLLLLTGSKENYIITLSPQQFLDLYSAMQQILIEP
jgi:hypothetical protein